jgi:RHS repeat-associated protein
VQTYDAEGRITSRCYDYGGAGPTDCFKATYDPVGNPLAMTDPDGTDTITYDALDRVTSVQRTNGTATITEAYAYDPIGALSEYAGTPVADQRPVLGGSGTAPSPVPASYNGVPITIDGVGNITSLAGTSLGYDLKGPLTSVAGLGMRRDAFQRVTADSVANLAYTYDGANRSISWQWSGTKWVQYGTWIYDGVDHPLEHVDASSNRQYYELDLAGNVRRLRAPGGADLGGYRYTAFGGSVSDPTTPAAPTGVNALPVRWKGRWLMYSTGAGASLVELYDMRARWWWPQGGVFVSVDGFQYQDNNGSLWAWPSQNPLRFSDPSGHTAIPVVFPGFVPGGQPDSFNTAGQYSTGENGLMLGHAGVVLVDDNTGNATFYEYGPYDSPDGQVHAINYGTVDANDPASINALLERLSMGAGHGGAVLANIIPTTPAQLRRMQSYARHQTGSQAVVQRGPYNATSNNCGTFARNVVDSGIGAGDYGFFTGAAGALPVGDFAYYTGRGFAPVGFFR